MATILLQNVGVANATFTQRLQLAASGANYPAGTVFDCTAFTSQNITSTINISRNNITFIFGAGVFSYTPTSGSMFQIAAQGVTIIGTNRNARDAGGPSGTTVFSMGGGTSIGYHIDYKVTSVPAGSVKGDCLVVKNCVFKGAQSVYTQVNGNVQYTTQGGGGFLITESNPGLSGQNVNNIIIDNVLISGTKQHGIFIYGAVACKITNTRVRDAAGHGFYIDGEGTSTSFDTCYASGNYLAGFCLKDAAYCSLLNCASDSNGLGYWLRNTTSTSLISCGAEGNVPRSNIPNNLGIVLPGSTLSPAVPINDIGSDNVNYIKGTSYFMSGGAYLTLTSPISKDPGGNATATVYPNKRTAHFGFYGTTNNVTITSPRRSGTAPVKYSYRIEEIVGAGSPDKITIGETDLTYDPLNPVETPDTTLLPVANILDQGKGNLFIAGGQNQSATGKLTTVSDPYYDEINNLSATNKLTIPTYPSHPEADVDTTIYFNSDNKKLYMWQDGVWYDTCCDSPAPPPNCYFPGGFSASPTNGAGPSSGMNQQRGTWGNARIGNKVFLPVGYSPNSTNTIGLQSYDLVTNTVVNYPNSVNMRGANSLVVGYSPDNEIGLYFAGIIPIPGSGGTQITAYNIYGTPYRSVVGFYNLVTGVCTTGIDTIIENYNSQSDENLAIYRMMKFDGDDSLHFLAPDDGIIRISTEDWSTLGIIPFIGETVSSTGMGPLGAANNIGYDGTVTTYWTEAGVGKVAIIPRNTTYDNGVEGQVVVVNIDNGDISYLSSSLDPNNNWNATNLICKDPETDNLLVVNGSSRSIAEIDNSTLSILNEWFVGTVNDLIGYPTFYTSNGVRYAMFYKFTIESITTGGNWTTTITTYNLTDDVLEGSVQVPNITGSISSTNPFLDNWQNGFSFYANSFIDVPVYSEESTKVYFPNVTAFSSLYEVCKPYHPAG